MAPEGSLYNSSRRHRIRTGEGIPRNDPRPRIPPPLLPQAKKALPLYPRSFFERIPSLLLLSLYDKTCRRRLKPAATISMLQTPAGCIPIPGSPFLSLLRNKSLRRTDVHTDRKFHVPAAVTFHGHMMSGRRGND